MVARVLKILFFAIIAKPLVLLGLGLNVRNRSNLPMTGPAIITPNHNSHLDTFVLMSLYPLSKIHKVRPVAAADYFLSNPLLAWFSLNVIGIISLEREFARDLDKLFKGCEEALNDDDILIFFPEGSRGAPEKLAPVKKGVYRLLKDHSERKLIPVVMHGLGRALPRGEALFVPFNCDVVIGESIPITKNSSELSEALTQWYNETLPLCLTHSSE